MKSGGQRRVDPLAPYFSNILMESKLIDLDPQFLKPTWTNRRVGEERIAKWLDRFLIYEDLLEGDFMFKRKVDSGAESYHLPICPEIKNPANPFKIFSSWLKNEEVVQIIQSNWMPYQAENGTRAAIHFTQNLLRIKKLLKDWAIKKKVQDE